MIDVDTHDSFNELGKALDKLGDSLNSPLDKKDYILDATTLRFKRCIELYFYALKHLLATQGTVTQLPKESLQKAYAAGWINNEGLWLDMLKDRNLTSHTYKHEMALEIYHSIQTYYPEMRRVYQFLKEKFLKD